LLGASYASISAPDRNHSPRRGSRTSPFQRARTCSPFTLPLSSSAMGYHPIRDTLSISLLFPFCPLLLNPTYRSDQPYLNSQSGYRRHAVIKRVFAQLFHGHCL
jgi:hypothetical protein